jgi:hypothetical protein
MPNRLAQGRRRPGHAHAELEPALLHEALVEAQREGVVQELSLLVPEHDREELEVDQPLDQPRDLEQQLLAVEDRGQLTADLVQQRERARLLAHVLVQPRVLDTVGQVPGDEGQQLLVGVVEVVGVAASHVEDSDGAVLHHQGNSQLGACIGHGADVAAVRPHVVQTQGPLGLGDGADDPLPQPEGPVVADLLGVAHREVEAQLLAQGVQEQDGEGVVGHVLPDTLGHVAHHALQLERRSELLDQRRQAGHGLAVQPWRVVFDRGRAGGHRPNLLALVTHRSSPSLLSLMAPRGTPGKPPPASDSAHCGSALSTTR